LVCHRELINQVQRAVARIGGTRVLEVVTHDGIYGRDKTHFNRAFLLELGPPLFQMVDASRQVAPAACAGWHTSIRARPARELSDVFRLRWLRNEPVAQVWKPEHKGAQCQIAVARRAAARGGVRRTVRLRDGIGGRKVESQATISGALVSKRK